MESPTICETIEVLPHPLDEFKTAVLSENRVLLRSLRDTSVGPLPDHSEFVVAVDAVLSPGNTPKPRWRTSVKPSRRIARSAAISTGDGSLAPADPRPSIALSTLAGVESPGAGATRPFGSGGCLTLTKTRLAYWGSSLLVPSRYPSNKMTENATSTTTVREAVPTDAEEIQRVARRAWHDVYASRIGKDAVEEVIDEWYDPQLLREAIETEQRPLFVAVCDEVVGFAQGGPSEEGPADAVVSRIYVHPAHWGDGIGTVLLDNLFDALRVDGHDSVWVPVWAENDVGRSFYDTRGFEIADRRPTELADQEIEELILVRDI